MKSPNSSDQQAQPARPPIVDDIEREITRLQTSSKKQRDRAWALTGIWLVAVAVYAWLSLKDAPNLQYLALNEFGDFFAGVFSPVAFLWLVFGYYQQGNELQANTLALRGQLAELAHSVKAQESQAASTRDSVDLYRDELFASTRPQLQLIPGNVVRTDETPRTPEEDSLLKIPPGISAHGYRCHWAFKNAGAHVTRVHLEMRIREGQLCFMEPVEKSTWPKDDTLEFYIFCSDKSNHPEHLDFTYTDAFGKRFGCEITLRTGRASTALSVGNDRALD